MEDTNQTKQMPPRQAGMDCPMCKAFIPISMHAFLYDRAVFCPSCGLRLEINKQSSAKAIEALRDLHKD